MSEGAARLAVLGGRYVLGEVIGRGGAAVVHLGKAVGDGHAHGGGSRGVVAIKKLHPHLATDPAFVAMMLDEARILSRVRHGNVVATLDVVMDGGELYVVMEYVHGVTLGALLGRAHARKQRVPVGVACAIVRDALAGLDAAHEATGAAGEPLGVVHRDVSPQNLLVAESGVLKVVDFGIAKAEGRVQHTMDGSIKGKLGYMPPEQLFGEALDRRADVYAAGVVLWEALVGERLFAGDDGGPAFVKSLVANVAAPGERVGGIDPKLDRVVVTALAQERERRFGSARAMAEALCEAQAPASAEDVAAWVRAMAGDVLDERGAVVAAFERASGERGAEIPARRGRGRLRGWAIAIGVALCVVGGGVAAVRIVDSREDGAAGSVTSGADDVVAEDAPASGTGTDTSVSTSASAAVSDVPSTTATASSATAAARPVKAPPSKPTPKANGCDPPFTIDAQGHKRYKRECLR